MLDNRKRTKIKNNKIQCWRLELASFSYTIKYRPGRDNVVADSLTRAYCASTSNLMEIHSGLCHPGITRLLHFVRTKNLPFSAEDVRKVCLTCQICSELKPRFYRMEEQTLVKATKVFEGINIDFKGPLSFSTTNKYILMVIDEYSRFPFAFPCPNMHTQSVINCLNQLFSFCSMPNYIHSDNAKSFVSKVLKEFLLKRGIASSKSSPYHPTGNSQVERYIGVIWKAIRLALKTYNLGVSSWEAVLPDALQSLRSLLNTKTNSTPHELFFNFDRRSPSGKSLPAWLATPGPILLRKFVKTHKNDDLVEEVQLVEANSTYASIRYADGREGTVSISDLAPCPKNSQQTISETAQQQTEKPGNEISTDANSPLLHDEDNTDVLPNKHLTEKDCPSTVPRRSTRENLGVPPPRYDP